MNVSAIRQGIQQTVTSPAATKVVQSAAPVVQAAAKNLTGLDKAAIKFFQTINNNKPVVEAMIALGITCALRPATIMALPGEKEDKQFAAAKSISSGLLGLAITSAITTPIKNAAALVTKPFTDKEEILKQLADKTLTPEAKEVLKTRLKEVTEKISKYPEKLKNLLSTPARTVGGKEVLSGVDAFKELHQTPLKTLISPAQAMIITAAVPLVMGLLFNKNKNKKAEQPKQEPIQQQPQMQIKNPIKADESQTVKEIKEAFSSLSQKAGN